MSKRKQQKADQRAYATLKYNSWRHDFYDEQKSKQSLKSWWMFWR